jgi:N-acetylmuramoyl-L-alanine amidase
MDHSHREASGNPTNLEQVAKFFVKLRQILNINRVLTGDYAPRMPGGLPTPLGIKWAAALALAGMAALSCASPTLADRPAAPIASLNHFAKSIQLAQTVVTKNAPASVDVPARQSVSKATSVDVLGDREETLFQLALTRGVTVEVYTLANPYRVIVDLPGVDFNLPAEAGRDGRGLVNAFRYGQFDEGKARVVLDTTGPVAIARATMTNARSGPGVVLTVGLKQTGAKAFGDGTGGGRAPPTVGPETPEPVAPPQSKTVASKPVVVIDAGHGGIDPGAVGAGNLLEKDLVLSVARRVQEQLEKTGRYQIVMTRSRDVFVSLNERLQISRAAAADLFISIHADSIEAVYAQSIKGATVYTLSERASDAEARAIAEKENASDLIAGLDVANGEENDDVKNILIDLMKRETANFSSEFSRTLVSKLKSTVSLSRSPERAAAFKVLRQTHAPSVLIEMGYVSNPDESRQMRSPSWQQGVAKSIANAVEAYFTKRPSEH